MQGIVNLRCRNGNCGAAWEGVAQEIVGCGENCELTMLFYVRYAISA